MKLSADTPDTGLQQPLSTDLTLEENLQQDIPDSFSNSLAAP